MGFDPLAWALGLAGKAAANAVLKTFTPQFPDKLLAAVDKWAKGLPAEIAVEARALFPKLDENDQTAGPSLLRLRQALKKNHIPTTRDWAEAIEENRKAVAVGRLPGELQPFFEAGDAAVEESIQRLSDALYQVCVQDDVLFRNSVLEALTTTLPTNAETAQPILILPSTDPAKAWLAFSSRATQLVGRDREISRLREFLGSAPNFSWWLVTGTAGSGKSRLALELCREADPEWYTGFLSRTEKNFNWLQFRPSRKTLIVIDYVASRAAELGEAVLALSRVSSSFTKPVRVLLVERGKDAWWTTFIREESQSESAEIAACQHEEPLSIAGLRPEAIFQLAEQVVRARNGAWNRELAREFLSRLTRYDPRGRPLFAMIVANYLDAADADTPNPNLLQVVLKREAARRSKLIQDQSKLQRMENLLLLATMVSGLLPKANSFGYLNASNVAGLLPDADLLDETLYNEMAGAAGASSSIAGLQPDILGERFVLDRLSADGIIGQNARRLLLAAWLFQPNDVRAVAIRSALDFNGDAGLRKLFDLPLDSSEARTEWGNMVGDLIAVTGRPPDEMSLQLLEKLTGVANLHPQERETQEATARAEYNMGQVLMPLEGGVAVELFDAAIARAGNNSPIGKAAIHNRAILKLGEGDDNSFSDFTMVIDSPELSDESRACAFNNRADLYAERGDHDEAIRDRTELLALKDTSPDRRYIALFRRSRSHSAIGSEQAALDDLGQILNTWDISPQQKAEARVERAMIFRRQDRLDEAKTDLEAVVNSSDLFRGTRAVALVDLAEVSRRMGDYDQADGLLSRAVDDPNVHRETLIDAMIVGALLLQDTGDAEGAIDKWRKIIAAPGAHDDQVSVAQRRLNELSQGRHHKEKQ